MYKIINRKKLWATRTADWIGKVLFAPRRLLRSPGLIEPGRVGNILLVRTAYVGDVVMTLPMLKPLKRHFPSAAVSVLTSSSAAPLLMGNPYVDEVITYDPPWFYERGSHRTAAVAGRPRTVMEGKSRNERMEPPRAVSYVDLWKALRSRGWDLVIEARGDIREILAFVAPARARYKLSYDVGGGGYLLTHVVPYPGTKHKIEYHLDIARFLGCSTEDELEWRVHLTDEEQTHAHGILAECGVETPFVCIHPGGRLPLKRWPEERYAALCDRLTGELQSRIVLLGSNAECEIVDRIISRVRHRPTSLAGKLDLRQLAAVLAEAALLVCNDSGPMHIATAMGTQVAAIFGPSKPSETRPYGDSHLVAAGEFPCRTTCDENHCRHHCRHACMHEVSVENVFDMIRPALIARQTGGPSAYSKP